MEATNRKVYTVAVLLFDSADILDFSGPLEIFANTTFNNDIENPQNVFKPVTLASTPTITAGRCMTIQCAMTVEHALTKIDEFDVLVVPGGNPSALLDMIQRNTGEVAFIKAFNNTSAGRDGEKIILSVCTGALFLGAMGVLSGLKATTHHMALNALSDIDSSIEVVSSVTSESTPNRYVDGGINKQGKRVITAGGVSCGLDASLYVAELKAGREAAEYLANVMEYAWKRA